MEKAKVYTTNLRTHGTTSLLDKLERLVKQAGIENLDFQDKYVAIKIHFGEPGNLAYLRPNYAHRIVDLIKSLGGKPFLTDCNTLYVGGRKNALDHIESAYQNGYNPFSCGCHILIADGLKGTDEVLVPIHQKHVQEAKIGRAIMDADIFITMTHFKGHESTGFGGTLKNIGMGCGSRAGKMEMHSSSKPQVNPEQCRSCGMCQKICAHSALNFDENHKMHIDISFVMDVSPCCDCHAENDLPIVPDIGIFASFDPVALDQACVDAVNQAPVIAGSVLDEHQHDHHDHFTDTHPDTNWQTCLAHGEEIGLGTREYELIHC